MTARLNRRAVIAGGLAVAGAYFGAKSDPTARVRSNLGQVQIRSASRDPIYIAMRDKHAQRLAPLISQLEESLDRRIEIDALSADELYASFTIDLLQQTGRYDVVSLSDGWIPYFGRRGYLTDVPDVEPGGLNIYPTNFDVASTGIDGTEQVAYPWTFDYVCTGWNTTVAPVLNAETWSNFFRSLTADPSLRVGIGLQAPDSAAEVYRSILLSFGSDLLDDATHEPILESYPARRASEATLRLAKLSGGEQPVQISQESISSRAVQGEFDVTPSIWATDTGPLWSSGAWSFARLPSGRPGQGLTSAEVLMLGVPAGAPNRDKAREFVRMMTSTEIQSNLWDSAGLLPARRSALNAEWSPGGAAVRTLALSALDHIRLRPRLRSFRSVMEMAGQLVAETVSAGTVSEPKLADANKQMLDIIVEEDELGG